MALEVMHPLHMLLHTDLAGSPALQVMQIFRIKMNLLRHSQSLTVDCAVKRSVNSVLKLCAVLLVSSVLASCVLQPRRYLQSCSLPVAFQTLLS